MSLDHKLLILNVNNCVIIIISAYYIFKSLKFKFNDTINNMFCISFTQIKSIESVKND